MANPRRVLFKQMVRQGWCFGSFLYYYTIARQESRNIVPRIFATHCARARLPSLRPTMFVRGGRHETECIYYMVDASEPNDVIRREQVGLIVYTDLEKYVEKV